ncbi:hypothetical protein [Nakamurella endophytica]|uniref:MinD-like ATPase involved in chromosome partitioning or flagellar assembly n=1 Tax=Nakamurella endophytica TaxID=1748367 RepID=A0A917T5S0_9ACTN|nr:hypothetical protein [Nakamurella endophytica]GGM10088.1 hypothetical protein GCM10011594_32520 [Nakamurella endophytica]
MIVSVCSDKGAPGVTTLATALGVVWPGPRAVVEADTAGSDLSFRLHPAAADTPLSHLAPDPSIAGLATAARLGLTGAGPLPFAQETSLGVPVVPGVLSAERFRPLRSLWPGLGQALAGWPGTVLADLGRLHPGAPAAPVAQASTAVLLLTRADLEGLFHVRDRVVELAGMVGPGEGDRIRVGVVVTAPVKQRRAAVEQVHQVLASVGSPAPVLGCFVHDPAVAQQLWAGVMTRRLAGSELVRSARSVAESVLATWPSLTATFDATDSSADVHAESTTAPAPAVAP